MVIPNEASSGDIAAAIVQKLDASDARSEVNSPKMTAAGSKLESMIHANEFVTMSCQYFQRNTCNAPHSFHASWHGLVSAIKARLAQYKEDTIETGDSEAKLSMEFLGTMIFEELDIAVPKWVFPFDDRILQVLAENEHGQVVDQTAGI